MITKVTILSNGNVSPNSVINLGNKYESVGDAIVFDIPQNYLPYHHYLLFKMKKKDTILLPVNYIKDEEGLVNGLTFFITTAVTKNAGRYEIIFLSSEDKITSQDDLDQSRLVFVSNTIIGEVVDNFLTDPINQDVMDKNLEVMYNQMLDVKSDFEDKLKSDGFIGPYYKPTVSKEGYISWTVIDQHVVPPVIPDTQRIMGPVGPYYIPYLTEDNQLGFKKSGDMDDIDSIDINKLIKDAADAYLDQYLKEEVDKAVGPAVIDAMDSRFKWTWNPETQTLYIETEELETIPEDSEGVEF